LSVAFTKEDSAETASETLLPDRPVSPHPNLVTEAGLKALELQLHQARETYEAAQKIEDVCPQAQESNGLIDIKYHCMPRHGICHRPSASPKTSGGSGQSSVSQMVRSSSASRTVTCWFARMQAVQATTIRRLMAGTD
jgi:hypothetical protein